MSILASALDVAAQTDAPTVMQALMPDWLNPEVLLQKFGDLAFWAAVAIIFAECGLLIGFFLPGDSLLFVVGMFIAQGFITLNIPVACTILSVSAILGNLSGFWIGKKIGPPLFNKPESKLFKQEYVDHTHAFFERYGNRAIVLARFTPIVRTFITAMAGVAGMNFRSFALWSALGGILWVWPVVIAGFFLGNIPFIKDNFEAMVLGIVFVSVLPIAWELWKSRRESAAG